MNMPVMNPSTSTLATLAAALLTLAPPPAAGQAVTRHFWDLEGTGNTYKDKIAFAHGSVNDETTVTLAEGRAANLQAATVPSSVGGNNDLILVKSNRLLRPGTSAFSFTGWFRMPAATANNRGIFDFSGNGGDGPQMLLTSANSLNFRIDGTGTYNLLTAVTGATVEDNEWHFFAAVYDPSLESGTLKFYLDDSVPAATASRNAIPATAVNPATSWLGTFNLSGATEPKGLDGDLDELAWYSGVLTEDQIAQLLAGALHPMDLAEPARINILDTVYDPTFTDLMISFESRVGVNVDVWGSENLGTWEKLTAEPIPGTGEPTDYFHVTTEPRYFLQVRSE
jgi:hypothetical protein